MTEYGRFRTDDPSEFEMALRPWDVLVDAPGDRERSFGLEYLGMPGIFVYRETYSKGASLIGLPPAGRLTIAMPDSDPNGSSCFGTDLEADQVYALADDALETRYGRQYSQLVLEIQLDQTLSTMLALSVDKLVSRGRNLAFARCHDSVSELRHRIRHALELGATGQFRANPRLAHMVRSRIENALSEVALPKTNDARVGNGSAQVAAVSAMLEYLRTPGVDCVSVAELCASAGVVERTLERGVRARFNCTVVQFLRRWRLHAARQQLVITGRDDNTVSQVAMSLGFFDLGRFASTYRHYFGENPSETLAASSRTNTPSLLGA